MQIQLIRSATLRITCNQRTFLIDPYFAPKADRLLIRGDGETLVY